MRYIAILSICFQATSIFAVAVAAGVESVFDNILYQGALSSLTVVQYDGPRYAMTEEDKARLRLSHETNTTWEVPASMPQITLEEGTILDFGVKFDSPLAKRSGNPTIGAFYYSSCSANTLIASVRNFGCGTGCITTTVSGFSGIVQQDYHNNPYPTMDVWQNGGCQGNKLQHFGVEKTVSCTNVNNCCGYRSFIGWYNC